MAEIPPWLAQPANPAVFFTQGFGQGAAVGARQAEERLRKQQLDQQAAQANVEMQQRAIEFSLKQDMLAQELDIKRQQADREMMQLETTNQYHTAMLENEKQRLEQQGEYQRGSLEQEAAKTEMTGKWHAEALAEKKDIQDRQEADQAAFSKAIDAGEDPVKTALRYPNAFGANYGSVLNSLKSREYKQQTYTDVNGQQHTVLVNDFGQRLELKPEDNTHHLLVSLAKSQKDLEAQLSTMPGKFLSQMDPAKLTAAQKAQVQAYLSSPLKQELDRVMNQTSFLQQGGRMGRAGGGAMPPGAEGEMQQGVPVPVGAGFGSSAFGGSPPPSQVIASFFKGQGFQPANRPPPAGMPPTRQNASILPTGTPTAVPGQNVSSIERAWGGGGGGERPVGVSSIEQSLGMFPTAAPAAPEFGSSVAIEPPPRGRNDYGVFGAPPILPPVNRPTAPPRPLNEPGFRSGVPPGFPYTTGGFNTQPQAGAEYPATAVKFFEDAIKSAAYKVEHHPKDVPTQPGMPTLREAKNLYADGQISRDQVNDAIEYWKARYEQNPKTPLINVDEMPEFQPVKGPHYVKKRRWVRGYGADRSRWEPYVPALED